MGYFVECDILRKKRSERRNDENEIIGRLEVERGRQLYRLKLESAI